MQFVSNGDHLHEISNPDSTFHAICLQWRPFAWNIKSWFLGKVLKHFNMLSAENFTQGAKR